MSILRIVTALCCLLLLSAPPLKAQTPILRDPAGAFSLPLPTGWKLSDTPKSEYKIGIATYPEDNFMPNVNIVKEEANLSLTDFVAASLKYMEEESKKAEQFTDYQMIKQATVKTKSGVTVVRVIYEATGIGPGIRLRLRNQTYFVAGKGDIKYIVTYSFPESAGSKYDSAVIASMTGFTLQQ